MKKYVRFILPKYCDVYKNFIVEELFYNDCPLQLHYGKCSVIGRIIFDENKYFIESISIQGLSKEYRLPDGFVKIPLITSYYNQPIPIEKTCELFGEAVFLDLKSQENEKIPKTSRDLMEEICDFQMKIEKEKKLPARMPTGLQDKSMHSSVRLLIQKKIDEMKKQFLTALKIHSLNIIDQPKELIECNLEIRILNKKMEKYTKRKTSS